MKMFRFLALAAALLCTTPTSAQWQTPNHSVPLGRGAGVTGFGSVAPGTAGLPLLSAGATSDPMFAPVDLAGAGVTGILPTTRLPSVIGKAVYYASSYGATCNGTGDDRTSIQAAITAAQVAGGIVQLPAGQCVLSAGLTASSSAGEIILRGVGMGAGGGQVSNVSNTQLLANFANGDVLFAVSDFGIVVEDMQFNSNVGPRSSGAAIHIKAANPLTTTNSNSIVHDVAFSNQVIDIQCTVCAVPRIFNTYHQAFVSHGILIDYVASAVESGGGYIYNNYMFGNGTDVCITSHAGYFDIHHNLLNNCQFGVSLVIDQRPAGSPFIHSNKIENCATTCIIAQNSGGVAASMLQITDNEFSTSNATSTSSIQILPNSGGVGPWIDGIQIARNIARNSLTAGGGAWTYNIQTGTNVQIVGNQSDHLGGDTSNMFLFGSATDLVAPVIVRDNTEQGATTGARYVLPTAQLVIIDPVGLPFASMPALAANGSQIFVTNGAPNSNPLTGASTGATALRQNGAWIGLGAITYGSGVAALLTGTASGTGGPAGTISPAFTTPSLGVATAITLNGNTFTTGTYTLTGAAGKTLTFNNSLTLAGTDATTMTFPATSDTVAGLATANAFTNTASYTKNQNSSYNALAIVNTNAGAGAQNLITSTTDAGQFSVSSTSTAGGAFSIFRWTGAGGVLFDQQNAAGSMSFRTGATPTTGLAIDPSQNITASSATASTSAATGAMILAGGLGVAKAIYAGAEVATAAVAVASLPTCNAAHKAARHFVTDANATFTAGIGAVVAAGGANNVPVTCDGTNWRIG